jgi:hypothetical protein
MTRRVLAVALVLAVGLTASPVERNAMAGEPSNLPKSRILLINQISAAYPESSSIRGQQVLMLLRHFDPAVELVSDRDYQSGAATRTDRVIVLGNDAVDPLQDQILHDLRATTRPTMWIGYGLGQLFADPDREIGFAPGFASQISEDVEVDYRGERHATRMEAIQEVRIASPDVQVLASIIRSGQSTPLAVRRKDFWFFTGLPGIDSDYPDPAIDTVTLVFADLLHDFFGRTEHDPRQAIIRLEDVSVHIPPERLITAFDALSDRRIPFVLGVIPAQRMADGSILALGDRPDFVQALRHAQERGGVIALHGYHHTFGQGEDFEFWDPDRHAPPAGETWDGYALKVEDGIRTLRDQGLDPMLWETPHYAASALGYDVFGSYFSHAIENRDPVTWLPYAAGPDPSGQILIPENIGYINRTEGRTVEAQLERARLLGIVRDALAVGFYHPASIPVSDLEQLVDGLRKLGYRFADVRSLPLHVDFDYEPPITQRLATSLRDEPGLTVLELQDASGRAIPALTGGGGNPWFWSFVGIGLFLIRLRAQWRPANSVHRSRIEHERSHRWSPIAARLLLGSAVVIVAIGLSRLTILAPMGVAPVERVTTPTVNQRLATAQESGGWEISTYFTAVERYYDGPVIDLRGCPSIDCSEGDTDLGRFRRDFLEAVKAEGSGRLSSSRRTAEYLNWSINIGYWLDSAPRDARGSVLEPYVSAAADPEIEYVSSFRIEDCGTDAVTGEPLDPEVCGLIRHGDWIVRDRFTVGSVGKHFDLYVGEQDRQDFLVRSPRTIHTLGASIALRPYASSP